MEEAAEGVYKPWRDPIFLLSVIANTAVPVGIAAFVAVRIDARGATAVTVAAVLALMVIHGRVVTSDFPLAIRIGFVIEFGAAAVAGLVTTVAFRRATGPGS